MGCQPSCFSGILHRRWEASSLQESDLPSSSSSSAAAAAQGEYAKTTTSFQGRWICKETWGLDAFLVACGTGYIQRKFALSAPWPTWEFVEDKDKFLFVNSGMVGEIREEFCADGTDYTTLNGWKQEMVCRAFWEDGALVITRSGPQGPFREERLIDANGLLQFTLRGLEAPMNDQVWGRTFERADGDLGLPAKLVEADPGILEMEIALVDLGFAAKDVHQVLAETSSLEEAASLLLERTEPSSLLPLIPDIYSITYSIGETVVGTLPAFDTVLETGGEAVAGVLPTLRSALDTVTGIPSVLEYVTGTDAAKDKPS